MRVEIRQELDVDSPVNLRKLSPSMKLYAGFMAKLHNSKWYQTSMKRKEEAEHAARIREDESLKNALLATLYRELMTNKTLESKDDVCKEVVLSVDPRYTESLHRILAHKDFIIYDIAIVEENPDLRRAFPDMSIVLRAGKRTL